MFSKLSILGTMSLVAVLMLGSAAQAVSYEWDGGGVGSDVLTAENWDPDGVPAEHDTAVVPGGYSVNMNSDWPVAGHTAGRGLTLRLGTTGTGEAVLTQTAGNLDCYQKDIIIGSGTAVGTYNMQGGSIDSGFHTGGYYPVLSIGNNNSGAAAPSGFIQDDGAGDVIFKTLNLATSGDNAKAYYEMNGGMLMFGQYGMYLTNSGSGQEAVFTQTDGTVSAGDWKERTIKMGGGVGETGSAIYNLDGGTLEVGTVRIAGDDNWGFVFQSTTNTYVDIAGGTLVLADELGSHTGTWDYADFTSAYDMANFRSFGEEITEAFQLEFTPTILDSRGFTTGDATGPHDATAIIAILALALTWDADTGTAGAQDGNGTWIQGGNKWWDGSGNVAWDNAIKTVATFGAGNATADPSVTVDTVTAGGIVFNAANGHNYTLTGGTITLEGDATIEANVDARIESVIDAGTAVFTKTGPGTLELTGANTYSGVAVTGGTLVGYAGVGDTGSILGDVDLSGGSNVTFNQGADGVYDGKISGDGSFTKTGAGTLVVTSKEHDYTGDATVSDGTLRVTGYLPYSTVTVEDGGTLGGGDGGRVGPIDLLQGGTLAPGASVGTLTADGDVTFGNGGNKLVAELLGAGADRVTVNGDLTLGDATALEFVFGGADPFQAGTYTLASYDTLAGTFSGGVTDLGAYTTGTGVAYGANEITITLDASLLPGDATLDRTVNLNDFARLRNNFGTGDTWAEADFNGDYTVNLDDFAILRNNFGSHVPEPATLALLALGGLVTLIRRRR